MQEVTMYQANDGSVYASAIEAKEHDQKQEAEAARSQFVAALLGAGYDKGVAATYARGAALFSAWQNKQGIPAPTKRAKKGE